MHPRRSIPNLVRVVVATLALVLVATAVPASAAAPYNAHERYILDHTNQLRASEGARALVPKDMLTDRARAWAADLARRNTLQHSDIRTVRPGWTEVGENVGRSTSVEDVFRRLEASPSHRENLVTRRYIRIGVGTARAHDGNIYVVQVFWKGCGPDGERHCS